MLSRVADERPVVDEPAVVAVAEVVSRTILAGAPKQVGIFEEVDEPPGVVRRHGKGSGEDAGGGYEGMPS